MPRLTKSAIEQALRSGHPIPWTDPSGKAAELKLENAKQRRLFVYLSQSKTREPKNLSAAFISGLEAAFLASDDPAQAAQTLPAQSGSSGIWYLESLETEGFGGINIWGGPTFRLELSGESLLLEGPNGSGKSSIVGAILWALTGERPRDQAQGRADNPEQVYGTSDEPVGAWPPIATYPPTKADLAAGPNVRVRLTFKNNSGATAKVERSLVGDKPDFVRDPVLDIAPILIEAGLTMPARLPHIRLREGQAGLTSAVQSLTGLDELIELGLLADGLCHKGREYLGYSKQNNLEKTKQDFEQLIDAARQALAKEKVAVPAFSPSETENPNGPMAALGKQLADRAASLTALVSTDLAPTLNLRDPTTQEQIVVALSEARKEFADGLGSLKSWQTLNTVDEALTSEATEKLKLAVANAQTALDEAIDFRNRNAEDSRFQLKALAARWHRSHASDPISSCPLCAQSLQSIPALATELNALTKAGDAASRAFSDNMNSISAAIDAALPQPLKHMVSSVLAFKPRDALLTDLRRQFVDHSRYKGLLTKVGSIVQQDLASAPSSDFEPAVSQPKTTIPSESAWIVERIAVAERFIQIATWFRGESSSWTTWWDVVLTREDSSGEPDKVRPNEGVLAHLRRVSEAVGAAEPFRTAADAMRKAWKAGGEIVKIQREQERREEIAEAIAPLKGLSALSTAVARQTINELSGRIGGILDKTYLADRLHFHETRFDKKEGVVVRGKFVPDLRIDATLVANTSWLRAVLWAFLFAIREEAVAQIGNDSFPVIVLDDPQTTFDVHHRHRWAQQIAGLQQGSPPAQLVLTTYDETFLQQIKVDGITGREALVAAAGPELGHIGILEGDSLDREWKRTQKDNTPKAGRDYMAALRVYVEGMLKLMLRGEEPGVATSLLGNLREKLRQLYDASHAPWDRSEFKTLLGALNKDLPPIKYIESSHHTTGLNLGMSEARDVQQHWEKKLRPALERGFRMAREHQLLHGAIKALHAPAPLGALPQGYQTKLRSFQFPVLGRAAAVTGGTVADGNVELELSGATEHVVLGKHLAFRLNAPTLEPVAAPGDILLVKEIGNVVPKSLVVAICENDTFARRFDTSIHHSDVAVLSAQAASPTQIAQPVVAKSSTIKMQEVVGVIYDHAAPLATSVAGGSEIADCGGEAAIEKLIAGSFLVKVVGQSAEPRALDGQFLIVGKEIDPNNALSRLNGTPVIAADSNDHRYFKRLRVTTGGEVLLESLDMRGDHPAILLQAPGKPGNALARVWPVVGVLFRS